MNRCEKRTSRAIGCRVGAGAVILYCGFCVRVCGAQNGLSTPADFKGAEVSELARTIADRAVSSHDRLQAYYALLDRDGPERREGLIDVLRKADEAYAVMAATTLIDQGDESVTLQEVLRERIIEWPTFQGGALRAIDNVGRPKSLLCIPRAILQELVRRGRPAARQGESMTSVDVAAKLLATSGEVEDRELFRRAVHVDPSSHGLWFGLARGGQLETEEVEFAQSVMRGDSYALLSRVAAATALAFEDARAKQFVVEQLRQFLQEFAPKNILLHVMVRRYVDAPVAQGEMDEMLRYRRDVGILQALLFLDEVTAKALTFDYLRSTDVGIRMTLGLVAAKRWPEELLGVERGTFPEGEPGEFDRLLAAIVFYHPNLRTQSIAKGSEEEIKRWLEYIQKGTVAVVNSFAGNIVAGW